MARKEIDCLECGANCIVVPGTDVVDVPLFCPFCGDGTSNAVVEGDDDDDEDSDDAEEDDIPY